MSFKVYQFLIIYVVLSTGIAVYYHHKLHNVYNIYHIALAFFLPLNTLICYWEICLGFYITQIKKDYDNLMNRFNNNNNQFDACIEFFNSNVPSPMTNMKFWSKVWSTYSLYDPSYSNRESFGFFVDVGNGWTTIIPSILYLIGMSYDILSARTMGCIGLVKFYQELYGTCIYFLSFILNKRYKNKGIIEISLFVGLSNGLWFFFPLLGMFVSYNLILSDSFLILR